MPFRRLSVVLLAWVVVQAACSQATEPLLSLSASPKTIDDLGQAATVTVTAIGTTGGPGKGTVVVRSETGSLAGGETVTLDSAGSATLSFSCTGCSGRVRVVGEWTTGGKTVTAETRVQVGVPDGGGGGGAGGGTGGGSGGWVRVDSGTLSTLHDVWGTGPNDVWAVGDNGTVLHWNGRYWRQSTVSTTARLRSIRGASSNDIWAVGEGIMLHWNGSTWTATTGTDNLEGVWAAGPDDVWAVGTGSAPVVKRWDGSAWSTIPSPAASWLRGVWGSAPTDVWVVGACTASTSSMFHFDGGTWSEPDPSVLTDAGFPPLSDKSTVFSVWGSGASDVWFGVGTMDPASTTPPEGRLMHWTDGGWASFSSGIPTALWGTGPSDVWAVAVAGPGVLHWNGTTWSPNAPATVEGPWNGVWSSGPLDVWIVGADGGMYHYGR